VDHLLAAARTRLADLDLQVHLDTTAHNVLALDRRALDVSFVYQPFESPRTPRFLRLGTIELVLALPESHRLSAAERVPRDELLKEPFLPGPRSINVSPALPAFLDLAREITSDTSSPEGGRLSMSGV
jgi:DNA-binding transcriptional LysR family regulator